MGTLSSNDVIIFILFPPAMNELLYPTSLMSFVVSALNFDHYKWMYILVADVALIGMTLITHKVSISLSICQCHILFSENQKYFCIISIVYFIIVMFYKLLHILLTLSFRHIKVIFKYFLEINIAFLSF